MVKERWVFNGARCNIDHRSTKRLHQTIIIQRTKQRMSLNPHNINDILNPPKKLKVKKAPKVKREQVTKLEPKEEHARTQQ